MADLVHSVRRFNRQWTRVFGLLGQEILQTSHTLTDARVIFELAQRPMWERLELREFLQIDDSYLTRIIARLRDKGLVRVSASRTDGRRRTVALTQKGRREFELLDARSSAEVEGMLSRLSADQQRTLGAALASVPRLLQAEVERPAIAIRGLAAGDLGWVIQRHGEIYFDEFGWNTDFEALVARIVSDYYANHKAGRESAWIAEADGARAGCVFCCEKDRATALLRILLVEPWARGLGLGSTLVACCVDFARQAGYTSLQLWTNDILVSARKIYEAAGFKLLDEEAHESFGHALVGQTWRLDL